MNEREVTVMNEVEEFLAGTMPRFIDAELALHNGDVEPWLAIWSKHDPVTVFGAWVSKAGWADLNPLFHALAKRFSDCESGDVDLVAAGASGELAYTVAYERTSASVNGVAKTYTLRVTQIYRREGGEWKLAHRHGDEIASGEPRLPATPLTR